MNHKPTLLYAEDDKESQENYAFILNEYFSKIYLASNGEEALTLFNRYHPDILLLDISMPLLDGLDLVEIIRKNHPEIPIVMLTAHSDRERLLKAVDLKLDGYLLKPVNVVQLKETLLALTERKQKQNTIHFGTDLLWNGHDLFFKDEVIKLTKKERLLIQYLCKHYGQYVFHDDLIIHIWNDEIPDFRHNKNLIQLVYRLNKKVNPALPKHGVFIENSYKYGYKIFSDLTPSTPQK
jgi:DNA-binding response OmpR family regulator